MKALENIITLAALVALPLKRGRMLFLDFQGKVLSAMRYGFGGHLEKSAK